MTNEGGIGFEQTIPWHEDKDVRKEDLTFFKNFTKGKAVIMGRNTWNSLPVKPLPNRTNIVISQTIKPEEVTCYNDSHLSTKSLEETLDEWKEQECLIIGGAQLYNYALKKNLLDYALIYLVQEDYQCDTFINFGLLEAFENQGYISKVETELGNSIILIKNRQTVDLTSKLVGETLSFNKDLETKLEVAFHEGINVAINFFGDGLDEDGKQLVHTQILKYQEQLNRKHNAGN